jgi:hypothetical protein
VIEPAGPWVPADLCPRLHRLAGGAAPEEADAWAVRHGIGPLLLAGGAEDPTGALAASRRRTEMAWQATTVHLERCLAALRATGVRTLVLKGAALALAHYPDPALRPMGDLDLLVSPAQWPAAARALEALDWVVEDTAEHGAALAGPGGARLELHGALASCPSVFPISFDDVYGRSVALAGFDGRRLGDEDTLVHLALHTAFQHGFRARLGHYVDLERLLGGPLDIRRLIVLATAARASRPLAASLAVAKVLLGLSPPADLDRSLDGHVPAALRGWMAEKSERPWELLDGPGLARARWLLADGLVCRARLLAGTLWPGRPDGSRGVSPWKALARGRRLLQHLQAR